MEFKERARVQALRRYKILDTDPEKVEPKRNAIARSSKCRMRLTTCSG
jgi:hypothetical protein